MNLLLISQGQYSHGGGKCVATILSYKYGQMFFKDITAKRIKMYLLKKNVGRKDVFTPLLTGDIHAVMKQSL